MKITNERLREFNQNNAAAPVSYDRQQFFEANIAALDRLAKLEEAVAFKGFDEAPENIVELLHEDGTLVRNVCCSPQDKTFMIRTHVLTVEKLKCIGYTGWRYPVGDLG